MKLWAGNFRVRAFGDDLGFGWDAAVETARRDLRHDIGPWGYLPDVF